MASLNKSCSVYQAFNFKHDMQTAIGHMEYLKIGNKEFFLDIELTNPINNQTNKVVGPISEITWDGGKINPIVINLNVSIKNKQQASELVFSELSNIGVQFNFVIYDYDAIKKVYYPSFHVENNLEAIINKNHGDLAINISDSHDLEVTSPKNYNLYLELLPAPNPQIIAIAFSQTAKMAKEWGVLTL